MTGPLLPRRIALAAGGLWLVGAALAASTGLLAAGHSEVGYTAVYAVVSIGLVALAAGTYRAVRATEIVTLVLLGSQILGVVGAAWELARGDDDGAKARHLDNLGINFRLALVANLVYSAAASAVFIWAWSERRRARRADGRVVSRRS
jgi:hypothetical protein